MNEKILKVVGILLSKPTIEGTITIRRYCECFDIILKPRAGLFGSELLREIVRTFPKKVVYVQENEDLGLHLVIAFSKDDEITD